MRYSQPVRITNLKPAACPSCSSSQADELSDAHGIAGWICRSCGYYWPRSIEVATEYKLWGQYSIRVESMPDTQLAERAQPTDEWIRRFIGEKLDEHLKRVMYGVFVDGKLS